MPALSRVALLLSLVALFAGEVAAQEFGRIEDTQAVAPGYFYFARPGEAVVAVTAAGGVKMPGRYLLGEGATVGDLLALSGGTGGASPGSLAGQDATVRLYRNGEVSFESLLRDLYNAAAPLSALQENDIVEVVGLISTARGYYVHSQPGQETVVVTAAGAFQSPGRYVLDEGARVGDLVALAGGLGETVRRSEERLRATVRVYREGSVVLESPLSDLYSQTTPVLVPGDVVDLESVRSTVFTWRDVLSIATAVGALALAADRLSSL